MHDSFSPQSPVPVPIPIPIPIPIPNSPIPNTPVQPILPTRSYHPFNSMVQPRRSPLIQTLHTSYIVHNTYAQVPTYMDGYGYVYICTSPWSTYPSTLPTLPTYIHTYIHIHTYTHTHIHTYTHTHIHKYRLTKQDQNSTQNTLSCRVASHELNSGYLHMYLPS
ncbi:uncharacterized protein BO80DRAFT_101030 [Aspergillus ibericus CBS 121593]|uniref:Uncharacterized protein n=1 Tax=Aspergillus ibericus CBS 121593 TaxID=1448316 RepID=A0A395H2Q9_9EURO|nr:hypothetical protein BO80DRAFT_101030 [Aspergillus ibericus CBS 121593]RAL00514.1 hypothetical protein BO80DRAFT_101030 [Aspergillus ibericus CBS 121593]